MTTRTDTTAFVLLHLIQCSDCQAPMAPAVRAQTRLYRCIGSCGAVIDARHAEDVIWERVTRRHRDRVRPNMPDGQRREVLVAVLRAVHVRGPSYLLSLRATWAGRRPERR